jgi:hypothetical protein
VARKRFPNIWLNYDYIWTQLDKPSVQSGTRIQVPLKIAQQAPEYFIGAESANVSRPEFATTAYYEWVTVRENMFYTLSDKLKNDGGPNAIADYVTSLMDNADASLSDDLANKFLGQGMDLTLRQFNSFQYMANDAADTLALATANTTLLGVTVTATQARTLGTLDKNLVLDSAGNKVYQGNVMNLGAGHGWTRGNVVRGLALASNGPFKPDLIVANNKVVAELIANAISGTTGVLRVQAGDLKLGFDVYTMDGNKIYGQRNVPYAAGASTTNVAYGINTQTVKFIVRDIANNVLRPWAKIPLQEAWYASRVTGGNFVCDDPRSNVVWYAFDSSGSGAGTD